MIKLKPVSVKLMISKSITLLQAIRENSAVTRSSAELERTRVLTWTPNSLKMQMTIVISPLSETRRKRGSQDDRVTAAQTTRAQAEATAEELSEAHVLKEEEIEVAEEDSSRAPITDSKIE